MTDHHPSDRDELVAAYLDGEATADERAIVEADPDLMERATFLRQVADMVAEPVMAPPPEVKRAHINAALAASPTAANVTALATRKRRMDMSQLAAVAAVVILVLAVPIVLLSRGGDDDDSTAAGQRTSVESTDAVAADDGAGDSAASAAGGDDGAEESAEFTAELPSADLDAPTEAEAESAPQPTDDADMAAADEAGDDGGSFGDGAGESAPQAARTRGEVATVEELALQLLEGDSDDGASESDDAADTPPIEDLTCVGDWLDSGGAGDGFVIEAGEVVIGGEARLYADVDGPEGRRLFIFDPVDCAVVETPIG